MCFIGTVVYHDYYMDKLGVIYFQSNLITSDLSTNVKDTLKHHDFLFKLKVLSPTT